MMPTDTLACQVTPDSVEPSSLSCSMPPLQWLDLWTMFGAWATALFTLALVGSAIWAGRIALGTLKQQQEDSYAAWRPYLTVQVVPSLAGAPNFDLVIENVGGSPAVAVDIASSDFPENPDDIATSVRDLFEVVTFVGVGSRTRTFWRLEVSHGSTWADGTRDPAGMPQKASLTVGYSDLKGKRFSEDFTVDTRIYKRAPVASTGSLPDDSLSPGELDLHKMLAVIATALSELRR